MVEIIFWFMTCSLKCNEVGLFLCNTYHSKLAMVDSKDCLTKTRNLSLLWSIYARNLDGIGNGNSKYGRRKCLKSPCCYFVIKLSSCLSRCENLFINWIFISSVNRSSYCVFVCPRLGVCVQTRAFCNKKLICISCVQSKDFPLPFNIQNWTKTTQESSLFNT